MLGPVLAALAKHAAPLSPEAAAAVARVTEHARAVQAALVAQAPAQAPGAAAAAPAQAQAPSQAPADGEAAAGPPSGFKKEVEDDANYIFQQARPGAPATAVSSAKG